MFCRCFEAFHVTPQLEPRILIVTTKVRQQCKLQLRLWVLRQQYNTLGGCCCCSLYAAAVEVAYCLPYCCAGVEGHHEGW
jgi:hypothetical protein